MPAWKLTCRLQTDWRWSILTFRSNHQKSRAWWFDIRKQFPDNNVLLWFSTFLKLTLGLYHIQGWCLYIKVSEVKPTAVQILQNSFLDHYYMLLFSSDPCTLTLTILLILGLDSQMHNRTWARNETWIRSIKPELDNCQNGTFLC